ncbi:MAG TPA: thioredoxin domain-containing protein [Cyclobacteriaceae bacterium]|nr:thioredoxin domain-containing protein [Cyclobacteriaceae bacterium]
MTNRLIHSTSPYLLQHSHNPVDWYEWGTEALSKAAAENKPILVSIGYSACHWCHVMERESFEKDDTAAIMNAHFVCIKVDREERPDVDQVYMEAVQTMGVNGGWPLNVFLTPDQKPFYGGTYFPPQNWHSVLTQIAGAFKQRREEINKSAEEISNYLNRSDLQRFGSDRAEAFNQSVLDNMFKTLVSRFDGEYGGMDKAPKFVMPTIWMFLLRYYKISGNAEALDMVTITLREMTRAGLYDIAGGGFARYSVDGQWFAPHFEKMLYDNAQLLSLYSEMYRVTNDDFYKDIVYETFDWLTREMTHPEGGFYSALDADSEGVEGKFYTWTEADAKQALGDDFEEAARYFNITPEGNWEHAQNILMRDVSLNADEKSRRWKNKFMDARANRIRPGLDDKILAGWNAMTIKGLTEAYSAFGDKRFLNAAVRCIEFLEKKMIVDQRVHRSFKDKLSPTEGFLEDYAFMIQAYTALYQCTAGESWIMKAKGMCEYVMAAFHDPSDGFFYYTSSNAEKLIARKKEIFDNVIPASNSMMAMNLLALGTMFDINLWKETATRMTGSMLKTIEAEPAYLSNWGICLAVMTIGLAEIAIVGPHSEEFLQKFSVQFLPFVLIQSTKGSSTLPLLDDKKQADNATTVYVCYNRTCQLPVHSVDEALTQLK